ncbi:oligosaccharyltransferase complex subunit ostc [Anaeramoeba ignava]|uniref:Oligosaccharyltransferase complex subunit ostc n=1 Tax=Anaeramoeba ignava TaxID=1746090 RepID=A0A9Q0LHA9_ANAIG|nr:oligosaccharyltransferase complex subunit ostc [Anaeramoeba ignava]
METVENITRQLLRPFRVPRIKMQLTQPPKMFIFGAIMVTLFIIFSGIVYDMIINPPSMGTERMSDGSVYASLFIILGSLGIVLIDISTKKNVKIGPYFFYPGVALFGGCYFIVYSFIKIKLPHYLNQG